MKLFKPRVARRTDLNVLFHQESDPKKRKEYDEENGEDDPTGCRDASIDAGKKLAHAVRAAIVAAHELRIPNSHRIAAEMRIRVRFPGLRLRLKLVGLPGVWTGRLVTVVRLLLLLHRLLPNQEFSPAKTTKLTFRSIPLSAILTLDHSDIYRKFHALSNA